jgi:hypothetical protein
MSLGGHGDVVGPPAHGDVRLEDFLPASGFRSWRYLGIERGGAWSGLDSPEPVISVPIVDDDVPERPESFYVSLGDATGDAFIECGSAEVIIWDDDIGLSIAPVAPLTEGSDPSQTQVEVIVTVEHPHGPPHRTG